jgi:hypothetical protein
MRYGKARTRGNPDTCLTNCSCTETVRCTRPLAQAEKRRPWRPSDYPSQGKSRISSSSAKAGFGEPHSHERRLRSKNSATFSSDTNLPWRTSSALRASTALSSAQLDNRPRVPVRSRAGFQLPPLHLLRPGLVALEQLFQLRGHDCPYSKLHCCERYDPFLKSDGGT